jgi:oxygen-independent coproporphyrinogen-3 oxidase
MLLREPPLALYVHLPWCVRKCPYCDFNSHAIDGPVPEQRYIAALLRDLELQAPRVSGRELVSVFLGGGTPSLFSPEAIAGLLAGVRSRIACAEALEITMEANPGTIERGRFAGYRAAGINRVSLGGQSFNARHLAALGRIHAPVETQRAVEELHAADLANFNIDLMYGLPGQTVEEAEEDIETAVALGPAHVSHYQLTLEPGTVFFHRPPALPDGDACWEMQVRCQERLARAGFAQYEISAYARPGRRCVHNLNYWEFGDYVGIGAGAHGKLTDARARTIARTAHLRQPRQYQAAIDESTPVESRALEPSQLPFEFMLNSLRLVDGFAEATFTSRTGLPLHSIEPTLSAAIGRGLLEHAMPGWLRPTELGLRFLNDLQAMFLADAPGAVPPAPGAALPANPR